MRKVSCDDAGAWRLPLIIKRIDCVDILNIFTQKSVQYIRHMLISIKVWAVMKHSDFAA